MSSLTRLWLAKSWHAQAGQGIALTRSTVNVDRDFISSVQGFTGHGFSGTTAYNELVPYGSMASPTHTNPYSSVASYYDDPGQVINHQPVARPVGISANYLGDVNNPHNHSAAIDPSESSNLFITRLPADITVERLLNTFCYQLPWFDDRIFGCSIRPARPSEGYRYAAASITTFTRLGAERLMYLINYCPGLDFDGLTAKCIWNRTLAEPPEYRVPADHSRVLIIRAHQDEMAGVLRTLSSLVGRPHGGVRFDNQDAGFWFDGDDLVLEWIFGSYRGQAANVKGLINREMPEVDVSFGVDPCIQGPGSNWRKPGWFRSADVVAAAARMEGAAEGA